ncbi:MAG: ATPase synthesis protein 25 mitochondrial [Icmadophila ericetorum]|nr:ATPase synthesis protein 25 mitochondrial [Icmadophila ericetorum]
MENPRAARQQLPELPVDTPALLQPILEHISIGLGLDDLSLFDLRKLDPPPALGANLLMVMGTARSEKHLHVSADRFCRWLRTTYKLSPYADGLLGRNELKLKTRRKVRRARLLSSVGSVEKNADDGIRTGWVCVNIGVIEAVQNKRQEPERLPGYIGFGGQTEGVKLVVQMFTEEKREELDLEGLWGGFLARQQRKEAREAVEQQEEAAGVEEVDPAIGIPMTTAIDLSLKAEDPSFEPMRLPQMYRNFHPSA